MAATSTSLSGVLARLDELVGGLSDDDLDALGPALFALTGLLDRNIPLRRAVTDPGRPDAARADLLAQLLGSQLPPAALELARALAAARWSSSIDMVDAAETAAATATVISAARRGSLDALEDDLFRFRRIVDGDSHLQSALTPATVEPARKQALLDDLLPEQVSAQTRLLLRQAYLTPRGRNSDRVLEEWGELAAARRNRVVAHVATAAPLTGDQERRLGAALSSIYGREASLEIEIDPRVVGGIQVQVGDEIIDGTVASRLQEARRRLAG